MTRDRPVLPARPPWKLFLWVAALGLLFGAVGFGEVAEDWLRIARNSFHKHPASGDIVFVAIDDRSLKEVGTWPWPRSTDGRLIERISSAGPKVITVDLNFGYPAADPMQDRALAAALKRSGRTYVAARAHTKDAAISKPLPILLQAARPVVISAEYNYQNAVWRLPYAMQLDRHPVRSMSSILSGKQGPVGQLYSLDYSTDVKSIPTYSATDVLNGRVPASAFAGKSVLFGTASDAIGDQFFLPGYGRGFGAQIQIIGAETLKRALPVDWGWLPAYAAALALTTIALRSQRRVVRATILTSTAAALLVLPLWLEMRLIFIDVTPALFVVLCTALCLGWRRMRTGGFVNLVTGLPNLNALNAFRPGRKKAIVAAKLLNYEEALATLPRDSEKKLVEQVISRFKVGDPSRIVYQGDGGIFAWFADPRDPFGNHLEALHALFRNPARVAKLSVDLSVTFGVEVGSSRSLASRLASALVAADEAARQGLKWRYHDPETLEDASWRLSILSQLDEAIDKGEVWIAYQPKLELATRKIIGAEALARWTHPVKGPIAATEFVAAAEHHNRIGKLTDFVLRDAVRNAAELNRQGAGNFEIAVNMSACLMTDLQFPLRIEALLAEHGVPATNLVLELTETAALASTGEGLEIVSRLRDLGVRIAIDDYGTGLSTLDYLKRVPAQEIKIDQSFVRGIADNRSDRLMVQSTIELAHSLGRRVVAEGAELPEIVDILAEMGCDIAQGYAIGRPMSLESLQRRLAADRRRHVA